MFTGTAQAYQASLATEPILVAAALIALRATNTRGEPISSLEPDLLSEPNPVSAIKVF